MTDVSVIKSTDQSEANLKPIQQFQNNTVRETLNEDQESIQKNKTAQSINFHSKNKTEHAEGPQRTFPNSPKMHHLIEAGDIDRMSQLVSENNGTLALGSMKSRKLVSVRDIVSNGHTPNEMRPNIAK